MTTEYNSNLRFMRYNYLGLSLTVDCLCASLIIGQLKFDTLEGNVLLYTILYNVLSISLRCLIAPFADNGTSPHTGVRLGVMLSACGFILPCKFGLIPKMLLASIGNAVFHAYCSHSVFSRSKHKSTDISLYTAGAVLGLGLAVYDYRIGTIALILSLILATPSDPCDGCNAELVVTDSTCKKDQIIYIPLLLFVFLISGIAVSSLSFDIISGKKIILIAYIAAFSGRIIGGLISDKINPLLTLTASCAVGTVLLCFGGKSKLLILIGIVFISLALPSTLSLLYRFMPNNASLSASLAMSMYYIGMELTKIIPFLKNAVMLPIFMGITLGIFFTAYINSQKRG